jgi:hypothetical protein
MARFMFTGTCYRYHVYLMQLKTSSFRAPKFGVPNPVTGSHPTVAFQ